MIYTTYNGNTEIDFNFIDETVRLSQQLMAELFKTSRTNIVEHIGNIYEEGELERNSTCRNFRQVKKKVSVMFLEKLHYSVHGLTATEVIYKRADSSKKIMGLPTFSGEFPIKKDIGVAKTILQKMD